MILKYHHTDKGFCRVCFTTKGKINPENEYYYCLQEEGDDVKMYRCLNTSQDAPWEPEYSVTFTGPVDILLPAVGDYDEYAESLISRWEEERKHDKVAL